MVSYTRLTSCRNYMAMDLVIAVYSGALQIIMFPNNFYLKDTLKTSASDYTRFQGTTQTGWVLKPLFGFFSDTFYPFRTKVKFYLVIISSIHILISIYFFFN